MRKLVNTLKLNAMKIYVTPKNEITISDTPYLILMAAGFFITELGLLMAGYGDIFIKSLLSLLIVFAIVVTALHAKNEIFRFKAYKRLKRIRKANLKN